MSFGVTPTGFVRKTLSEILDSLESGWRDIFGASIDLSESSPDAQILGLFAGALDEAWQAAAALYGSYRPSQSVGAALSEIVLFNGISRKIGTPSLVATTITTTGSVNITSSARFASVAGDLFAPTLPGSYANGSTVLLYAVEKGPITVPAGELNRIVTPISKLTAITNPLANYYTGAYEESDAELRARQLLSTENSAINILEALYASLGQLDGVTALRIYVNDTAATVAGRPAKSYEVVIQGGDDAEIADTIWDNHPAGIEIYGTTTQNITDSQGNTQAMKFTRPTPVDIIVNIVVAPTSSYPGDGDAQIKQAILDYAAGLMVSGEKFGVGDDVLLTKLYTPINSIPGHHVTTLQIGAPSLGTSDLTIAEDEIANFTIANITVTS